MKIQYVFGNPIRSGEKMRKPLKSRSGSSYGAKRLRRNPDSALKNYVSGLNKAKTEKEEKEEEKPKKAKTKTRSGTMAKKKAKKAKKGKKVVVKSQPKKKRKSRKGSKKKSSPKKRKKKVSKKKVSKKSPRKKASKKKVSRKSRRKVSKVKSKKSRKSYKSKSRKSRKSSKKKGKKSKTVKAKGKGFSLLFKANPGGAMSKLEKITGMSMPEAGGLLVGGLAYGAVNSLLSKIPVVKTVHAQLLKVPVIGSALPTLIAGALLNLAGDKYKLKAASMLGKGLIGAAVVGMGVNASQLVPGLKGMSGVDLTMGDGQLGDEADFGDTDEADFGELISYNDQAYSGVDYTMGGVDYTMGEDNPADFGELIDLNEQALSGGQLG
jgi:hypothetical protein